MQSVVLKCNPETQHEVNESQKRGTATEHATQPVVLVQVIEGARADRADDSLEHLETDGPDITHIPDGAKFPSGRIRPTLTSITTPRSYCRLA